MLNLEEIWGQVLGQLQLDMPKASYETWAKDAQAVSLEKNVLTVCARNAYARDWLESRMSAIAPNMCALIGARIAAQLMGQAGGLAALSNIPSCNLQVRGAAPAGC